MKKLLSLLLIICSIGVAYADDKSTVTSLKYVTDELNTRQDKFGANDGKAMTFTNVAGGNLPRDVKASLGTSTTDSGLPTVSAVNTGIATKQDEIGAANTNTVVTYTGTPGTLGQKGIYQDSGTYATQSDNLIKASTFNAALRNGLENEFVCADRDPVSNQCWLWTIHNDGESANLFNGVMYSGGLSSNKSYILPEFEVITSPFTPTLQWKGPAFYTKVKPNTTYVLTYDTNAGYKHVAYYANESDINTPSLALGFNVVSPSGNTFTTPDGTNYVVISFVNNNTNDITWSNVELKEAMPDNALLPTGYTPLEYIGASSGQFINTGINPTDQMIIKTDILFTSDDISVFGGSQNNTNKMQVYKYQNKINVRFHNQTSSSLQPVISNDNWYSLKIDYSNSYGTINDTTTSIIKTNAEQVTYPIYIWANNVAGTISGGTGGSYIKFFEIRNSDGTNLFYGVPARRNSDNVVGMYDTVSNTFKTNAGTGTFTAGPDVSNIVYIPQGQN